MTTDKNASNTMVWELPGRFKTVRGHLNYSTMDIGDRQVAFLIEPEDGIQRYPGRSPG
jgi:hypothetical protein